jgi:pyrroline-5-carboxylate reductase
MAEGASGTVRWAFVGCGNLGSAILSRAVAHGAVDPASALAVDGEESRRAAAAALGVRATADAAAARAAANVVLAVKPQQFEQLARELGRLDGETLVVSAMAGWSSASVRAMLGGQARVVRAMPNTPATVGLGFTAVALGAGAAEADVARAQRLFAALGGTCRVEERLMDAATAAIGSAPAYLYLLAEAQVAAARELGLDEAVAREATVRTMLGAASLMATSGRDPAQLRADVTSAGGTTAAAVRAFEERGFRDAVAAAMRAARDRAAELGR